MPTMRFSTTPDRDTPLPPRPMPGAGCWIGSVTTWPSGRAVSPAARLVGLASLRTAFTQRHRWSRAGAGHHVQPLRSAGVHHDAGGLLRSYAAGLGRAFSHRVAIDRAGPSANGSVDQPYRTRVSRRLPAPADRTSGKRSKMLAAPLRLRRGPG